MMNTKLLLPAIALTSLTAIQTQAAVTTLDATQDGFVRFTSPGNSDERLIVGNNDTSGPLRGLLVFDLSSIAATDTITSVSLELTVRGATGDIFPRTFELTEVSAFDADPTWNEIDNSPTLNEDFGTVLASTGAADIDTTTTFASTAGFESYVEGAFGGNIYFALQDSAEVSAGNQQAFLRYDAIGETLIGDDERDAIVAKLTVTHVPEPGSLALIALGGLCVLRRRRG